MKLDQSMFGVASLSRSLWLVVSAIKHKKPGRIQLAPRKRYGSLVFNAWDTFKLAIGSMSRRIQMASGWLTVMSCRVYYDYDE